jgi:hypothetical protein
MQWLSDRGLPLRLHRKIVQAQLTRLRYRLGRPTLATGPVRVAADFRHPIDQGNKATLVAHYRIGFADNVGATIDEARRLLEHRFRFLGHGMQHGREIAWSRDPISGKHWSRGFSPDIAYRGADRLGDIKLPWELGKHQYFFTLGKAAWLTDELRFAQEIVTQIDHWIRENPCHSGIHWISALESGARAISWVLAYPFFASCCDPAFIARLCQSLAQHFLFVERQLSVGRFTNTHLAGEAAALVIGGLFLECRHSKRWMRKGLRHLQAQMIAQVREDGAHAEQSAAYHRFFLDQYFLVEATLRANGRSLPAGTLQRMERMTGFLMDFRFPDGTVPSFGDCDDARGIWCTPEAPRDFSSLLALGAVLFQRGDFKSIAGRASEEILWLYGQAALDRFKRIPAHPPDHTSSAYRDAGYYIMRDGWNPDGSVLAFDCGPLGHGPAGHGHADALSFQLYTLGYPFLVDSGTYSYNLDYRWRDLFRSTRAHNTLAIDGLDQSVTQHRMAWSFMAPVRCHRWLSTPEFDLVDAEHEGYQRLTDPVTHRRIVVFLKPDIWLVYDLLTGAAPHEAEMLLHVRPDCRIEPGAQTSTAILRAPGGQPLYVRLLDSGSATGGLEVLGRADEQEAMTEFSEEYGCKARSNAIRALLPFCGRAALLTGLSARADFVARCESNSGRLDVTVIGANGQRSRLLYPISTGNEVPRLAPI